MTTMTDRDKLATLARRSLGLMAHGGAADFREVVHPLAVNREAMSEPPPCRTPGPEGFHATAHWLRTAYSDLAFTVDEVVVEGDLVVTHGTMSGRHTGPFVVWNAGGDDIERVFAPTRRTFAVQHVHFQRFRSGQVIEHWAVRDDNSQALQLGWVPPSPLFLLRCAWATTRTRRAAVRRPA